MKEIIDREKQALDAYVNPGEGFEWEWPAVWVLIGLAVLWLWRTRRKNEKERLRSTELCRSSLHEND